MPLGSSGRRNEPLYVIPMAAALVAAATLGALAGVLWHASGFGGGDGTSEAEAEPVVAPET